MWLYQTLCDGSYNIFVGWAHTLGVLGGARLGFALWGDARLHVLADPPVALPSETDPVVVGVAAPGRTGYLTRCWAIGPIHVGRSRIVRSSPRETPEPDFERKGRLRHAPSRTPVTLVRV